MVLTQMWRVFAYFIFNNNLVNKVLPPTLLCAEEAGLHRWPHEGCPASVTLAVTSSASPTLTLRPPT